MTAIILGSATIAASIWAFLHWPAGLPIILRTIVPGSFIMGGLVSIIAGISLFRR